MMAGDVQGERQVEEQIKGRGNVEDFGGEML